MTINPTKAEINTQNCATCGGELTWAGYYYIHADVDTSCAAFGVRESAAQPGAVEPPERIWLPADTDADTWNILAKNPSRNWRTGEPSNNIEYRRVQPEQSGERATTPRRDETEKALAELRTFLPKGGAITIIQSSTIAGHSGIEYHSTTVRFGCDQIAQEIGTNPSEALTLAMQAVREWAGKENNGNHE